MRKNSTDEIAMTRRRSWHICKTKEDFILDAAERAILKKGYNGATLEHIAHEAGFSKGGLMHHFPSKQEIVVGVLDRLERRFASTRQTIAATLPPTGCLVARASILSFLHLLNHHPSMLGSVMEMFGEKEVRNRIAESRKRLFAEMSAGSRRPERVGVALLLAEGLCLNNYMRPSPFQEDTAAGLITEVMELLDSLEGDFT